MHKKSVLQCLTLVAATAAALGLAATAQAGPTLNNIGYASNPNGGDNVHIVATGPGVNRDILAGGFVGTQTDLLATPSMSTILFWCFELDEFFSMPGPYTNYTATSPGVYGTALGELFTEVFGGAAIGQPITDLVSAAFQLAVWEIRYETSGTYNIGSGTFSATSGTGSVALAQTYLAHLGDPGNTPSKYIVQLLHAEGNQDFVTATPRPPQVDGKIPEPSALPLLGLGMVAMLLARRRRLGTQV